MSVRVRLLARDAFEADAAVGFRSEAPGVEEFVGEGAVEALGFAVSRGRYGRVRRCAMRRRANIAAKSPEQKFAPLSVMTASTGMSLDQNQS